jgi:choline dehydrogenase-like flavoprotein
MVGGGTRVFGAQAWRFCPEDFRMASTYGIPDGSSLADWPISYEDLEPDYDRAEWELGVSGDPAGNAYAGPRRRGYPMPPLPPNGTAAPLRQGAAMLGLATSPVPFLINSMPYNGRGACLRCGACVGFGCPGEFKTDTRNTVIPRAVATSRCDVLTETQAERVITDADGRVIGVALVAEAAGETMRRQVNADQVLLGSGGHRDRPAAAQQSLRARTPRPGQQPRPRRAEPAGARLHRRVGRLR